MVCCGRFFCRRRSHDRDPARQRSYRRVTGKGIVANVKDFTPRWVVISLVSLLVMANPFNIAADLAAMGEVLSLVNRWS